jgi:membrane protease YdiL (CAAX protease family)
VRAALTASTDRLAAYLILPVVALLLASTVAYGTYFALIHSPLHWPFTFTFGALTGYYYTRERNLLHLMISRAVVDFWSFGWFLSLR